MNRSILARTLAITALAALPAVSQHVISHFDGSMETTSRGANAINNKGLFQRYPANQISGCVMLTGATMTLQDQNIATAEAFTLEVRLTNPAAGPAGAPNLTAAGLIGLLLVPPATFPGPGPASALAATLTFPPGVGVSLIPTGPALTPDDLYVGINCPAQPAWPSDGLSLWASATLGGGAGEQFRAGALGYTGTAGVPALGWDVDFTANTAVLGTGNRSWKIGALFAQDTLRPFAFNPAVFTGAGGTGLNPNFGYVGLWPDSARGDALGFSIESSAAVGSSVIVAYGLVPVTPMTLGGVDGRLCLNLSTLSILFPPPSFTTVAAAGGSKATLGPFGLAGTAGLGSVYLQAATVDAVTGAIRLTNLTRINF